MLVSSWREVGIPSRVERVDSQPVLGRSNKAESVQELRYNDTRERKGVRELVSADRALPCPDLTLLLRPGPIDLEFCTSSGRAR